MESYLDEWTDMYMYEFTKYLFSKDVQYWPGTGGPLHQGSSPTFPALSLGGILCVCDHSVSVGT